MATFLMTSEVSTDEVHQSLMQDLGREDLVKFVVDLDQYLGDWDFTRDLRDYFVGEMDKLSDDS